MTGGLTASVGIGTSKFVAKVASDLDKPDGLVVVRAGTEQDLLRPMHVTVIPGVGPGDRRAAAPCRHHTVADLERVSEDELVRLLGKAHGHGALPAVARAEDDRPVVPERETKSVSVEGTYDTDLTDRRLMEGLVSRQAAQRRRAAAQAAGSPAARSPSRSGSTTSPRSPGRPRSPRRPTPGRRSPGWPAGCSASSTPPAASACSGSASPGSRTGSRRTCSANEEPAEDEEPVESRCPMLPGPRTWAPGMDVVHEEHGRGWVWGAGRGIVTVRFETAETAPGPVRSLPADDPALSAWRPA